MTVRRRENKDMTSKERGGISKWREVQSVVHRKVFKGVHGSKTQNLVVCYITAKGTFKIELMLMALK